MRVLLAPVPQAEEPPLTHTHKQEAPGAEEEAAAALEELMKLPENNLKRAYLDVTRDGMPLGRIVLEVRPLLRASFS